MMRREFIAGLGTAAVWSQVAKAQQPARPVVGFLGISTREDYSTYLCGRDGLSDSGFVEGMNLSVECRSFSQPDSSWSSTFKQHEH